MIIVSMQIPSKIRLRINGDKLSRNVGNRMASHVKRQWRKGLTAGGEAIPATREGERPLYRTGTLMKSVRFSRYYTFVTANNRERTHNGRTLSRRAWSLYGLARILMSGKWRRGKKKGQPVRAPIDLYGDSSDIVVRLKQQHAQTEIDRQLSRGEAGLVAELAARAKYSRRYQR